MFYSEADLQIQKELVAAIGTACTGVLQDVKLREGDIALLNALCGAILMLFDRNPDLDHEKYFEQMTRIIEGLDD